MALEGRRVAEAKFPRSLTVLNGWGAPRKYLSVTYTIEPQDRLVASQFCGVLSARGLEMYAASLRADPRFDPTFAELVDLRKVDEIHLLPEDALRLADQVDPFVRDSKRAFVAQTQMQVHSAKMHQLLQNKRTIQIFSTIEEARRWVCS